MLSANWKAKTFIVIMLNLFSLFLFESEETRAQSGQFSGTPHTDFHGDELPQDAMLRLGTIRFRQLRTITSMAVAADGKLLACSGSDATIYLWDPATGKPVRSWQTEHNHGVRCVAFAPDGQTLASAGYRTIRLWQPGNGSKGLALLGHRDWIHAAVFSPDGKTLNSASHDKTIRQWDVATGRELRVLVRSNEHIVAAVFAPAANFVAFSTSDGFAHVWDLVNAKETLTLDCDDVDCRPLAFSADGAVLAMTASGRKIRLVEVGTGKEIGKLTGHHDRVNATVFAPDGQNLASASADKTVRLWNLRSGTAKYVFNGGHAFLSTAFTPDGKTLLAGGYGGTIHAWNSSTGGEIMGGLGHQSAILAVTYMSDGKTLLSADNTTLRRLTVATGETGVQATGGSFWAAIAQNGSTIAGASMDGAIRSWQPATGRQLRTWNLGKDTCASLALSSDGKLLAVGSDQGNIRLWNTITGDEICCLAGHEDKVAALSFSSDGKMLASAGGVNDATVRLWDVASGTQISTFWQHSWGDAPTFAPGDKVLACITGYANDKVIQLWDIPTGKLIRTLPGHGCRLRSLAFSPDGRTLAAVGAEADLNRGSGEIQLWEKASGSLIRRLSGHRSVVNCAAFAADGRMLATGSADTTILIWPVLPRPAKVKLSANDMQNLWAELSGNDAMRAYRAIAALAASPEQFLPWVQQHLPGPLLRLELAQLIADLGSNDLRARQNAIQELERIGPGAEVVLRQALAERPPLEMRRRLEDILEMMPPMAAAELRWLRTIQTLELIGTDQVAPLLTAMAEGASTTRLSEEAMAALARLSKRTDDTIPKK